MEKFIKISDMRALEKRVSEEKISYSKMIEIINKKAYEYGKAHVEEFKIKQAEFLIELHNDKI